MVGSKGAFLPGIGELAYGRTCPWRSTAQAPWLHSNLPHLITTHSLTIRNCTGLAGCWNQDQSSPAVSLLLLSVQSLKPFMIHLGKRIGSGRDRAEQGECQETCSQLLNCQADCYLLSGASLSQFVPKDLVRPKPAAMASGGGGAGFLLLSLLLSQEYSHLGFHHAFTA